MPSQHAVLIVDADPKGLESLVYGFQGADWRMTACPSPETASLLVKASGAQIVVIATRAEHERTHTLVRQLRGKELFRTVPVLVLGPEELRHPLKEHGEVDLLTLPTFVRDVLTASELLLTAGSSSVQTPEKEPCLQSPIAAAKTLSLVRTMNGLARSGQMRLERNGRAGEIMFHEGELTSASIGPLQGMAAVQHLMIWNDGKLELRLRKVPRRGQLKLTAQEFLQELDRFQREFAHGLKEIGPATTVYSANPERLKQSAGAVPAEVTPVVRLCDGIRTLSDVIDESPFRVLDTVRILGRLAVLGILTRADGKPVAVTSQAQRDEFLENARITGSGTSWPMPAPIEAPAQAPILRTPVPPTQPPKEAAKESTSGGETAQPSQGEPRKRKQTLEIGIPTATANAPGQVPAPTVAPTATPAAAAPAAQVPAKAPATPTVIVVSGESASAKAALATPATRPTSTILQGSGAMAEAPAPQTPKPVPQASPASVPVPPQSPFPLAAGNSGVVIPVGQAAPKQTSGSFSTKPSPVPATRPVTPASSLSAIVVPQSAFFPSTQNSPATSMQAAGVIDSRKNERRRTQPAMRAAGERRSVVIEAIQAEDVITPVPTGVTPPPRASVPSPSPEAARTPGTTVPVTGVLQVTTTRRSGAVVVQTIRPSIQLDASLATPPPTTPLTPVPAASKPEPASTRVTGEMHVAPSGRTTRGLAPGAPKGLSFQIDPSLSAASGKTPQPVTTSPAAKRTDSRPILGKSDSRPIPLSRSDSRPIDGSKRHQSGSFSTVEKDFFDREADLYKQEKAESFADLDEGKASGKGKAAAKGKGSKPGRPYRK